MKKRSAEHVRLIAVAVVAAGVGGAAVWVLRAPAPQPPPRYVHALPPAAHEQQAPAPKLPAPPPKAAANLPEPGVTAPSVPKQPAQPAGEAPPWKRFAVASPPLQGRIPIALVIDDMGVDQARSRRALDLPPAVTMSFLPYAHAVDHQAAAAWAKGHELLVHVSMEADSRAEDPGPNALYTDLAPAEIARRFDWAMTRFPGYVGFNNHMGSRFTSFEPGMRVVLADAQRRGVMFLDSKTAPEMIGVRLATELGVPYATRQVFLDNVPTIQKVTAQLAELERIARKENGAIAIGHPRDATLAALGRWIPTLESRGFVLVPVTAMVHMPKTATAHD